jgi:hypothetical protein
VDYELAYRRLSGPEQVCSEQELQDVLLEFEFALAEVECAPEAHIDFACRVLSDPNLINRPGIEFLVMDLQNERWKFTDAQLSRLLACAMDNFGLVTAEDLAVTLGDLVAQVLPPEEALQVFRAMTAGATSPDALRGVFTGLGILRRDGPKGEWQASVSSVLKAAQERIGSLTKE